MLNRHRTATLLSLALLATSTALAQTSAPATAPTPPKPAEPKPEPKPPQDLKVTMMDGSVVAGKLSVPDLTIQTNYGTLKVPVDQIQSFAPGIKSHPDFEQKINALVNDLAADAFADREKAQTALAKLGPEIKPELDRQLKTAESEKQMRLQKILEDFEAMKSDDDADTSHDWTRDDVIVTPGFTIVGKITTNAFAVASQYGTLQLKLSDVRQASRGSAEPEELRKTLAITGTAITQHAFTNAGFRLNKGDQVSITATGTIQMTPWGNMQAGPDGGGNFGMVQPGNIPGGALIAKVAGDTVKVGSKYSFTASKAGPLEFGIAVPGDYSSYQFPGEFSVKIRVIRKQ